MEYGGWEHGGREERRQYTSTGHDSRGGGVQGGGVPFGVSPAAVVVPEHPGVGQPAAATAAVRAPEVLRKQRIHG